MRAQKSCKGAWRPSAEEEEGEREEEDEDAAAAVEEVEVEVEPRQRRRRRGSISAVAPVALAAAVPRDGASLLCADPFDPLLLRSAAATTGARRSALGTAARGARESEREARIVGLRWRSSPFEGEKKRRSLSRPRCSALRSEEGAVKEKRERRGRNSRGKTPLLRVFARAPPELRTPSLLVCTR